MGGVRKTAVAAANARTNSTFANGENNDDYDRFDTD
jgi:hypothetical protein